MTASIIIPHRNSSKTLPRTLESLDKAAKGMDVEMILIEDVDGRGPSWARNRGLEKARGEFVFFVDADDTVEQEFLRRPMAELNRTGADLCFFTYNSGPELNRYVLKTNEEVRSAYLPAFFGYSFNDVKRWNQGGDLMLLKELGQVWRLAYRREFLEKHKIRFDENMTLFEDAAFISNCVAFASSSVSIPDKLYSYTPSPEGNLASGLDSRRHWEYKIASKRFRVRLDEATGGKIWRYCEASIVFSALEMLRLGKKAGLSRKERAAGLAEYLSDEKVRDAIRAFPVSWLRHPLVALGVSYLRMKI